jgi:cytochrome c-type protein NapC
MSTKRERLSRPAEPFLAVAAMLVGVGAATPGLAATVDWASVPGKEVVLFYPGQSSWEWVLTPGDHSGAPKFREGKNCHECHDGEQKTMGATLSSGKKNEPNPIAGKPAFVAVNVKFAHDADTLYAHFEFNPGSQPDAKMDAEFETKITLMLNDGKVAEATRAGCWGTCHEDLIGMPAGGGKEITKYLTRSRSKMTRQGGDGIKPADDLAKIRADGGYLEFWQAKLRPGAPAVAVAGTILDKREEIGSPAVAAEASAAGGVWSVTLSRKLGQGAPYKPIAAGGSYTFGLAIHAGHTAHRFHYVSFENSLVLDKGSADFIAVAK